MDKILLLATTNAGKVKELKEPLAELGFTVQLPPKDFPEVPETGATFTANALIKARALAEALNLPALADDSGLEVQALNNAPGIYSARYADDWPFINPEESRDQRNMRKLIFNLATVPAPRLARFCCAMALVWPQQGRPDILAEGYWQGEILPAPQGSKGFGYDPLFFDPKEGLSAAQMPAEQKMRLSHRSQALKLLLQKLKEAEQQFYYLFSFFGHSL